MRAHSGMSLIPIFVRPAMCLHFSIVEIAPIFFITIFLIRTFQLAMCSSAALALALFFSSSLCLPLTPTH